MGERRGGRWARGGGAELLYTRGLSVVGMRVKPLLLVSFCFLALSPCRAQDPGKPAEPATEPEVKQPEEVKPETAPPPETPVPAVPKPAVTKSPADGAKLPETPPTGAGAPVDPKSYVLGPEDIIAIRVWREPDLSGSYAVRPDGKISIPLINEVQAAGLTPQQLTVSLAERLTKFINRPEVTVSVQTVNSKKYFITGEVARIGAFPMPVPMTVLDALIGAGGFREFANTKKIYVLRGTKRFTFNYNQVIKGKHMEQNIQLENGDKIVVP